VPLADTKLAKALQEELKAEEDFDSDEVKSYLRKTPFKLIEQPENMEVMLKRTMGNEE